MDVMMQVRAEPGRAGPDRVYHRHSTAATETDQHSTYPYATYPVSDGGYESTITFTNFDFAARYIRIPTHRFSPLYFSTHQIYSRSEQQQETGIERYRCILNIGLLQLILVSSMKGTGINQHLLLFAVL